jgi:hypothetical protein
MPRDATADEQVCLTYCESFYDYEACRTVCLAVSHKNLSLFVQARRQAENAGLNEEHALVFAAGAVSEFLRSHGYGRNNTRRSKPRIG